MVLLVILVVFEENLHLPLNQTVYQKPCPTLYQTLESCFSNVKVLHYFQFTLSWCLFTVSAFSNEDVLAYPYLISITYIVHGIEWLQLSMDIIESCERTCTVLVMISFTDYYANTDFLPKCVVLLPTRWLRRNSSENLWLFFFTLCCITELILLNWSTCNKSVKKSVPGFKLWFSLCSSVSWSHLYTLMCAFCVQNSPDFSHCSDKLHAFFKLKGDLRESTLELE